MFYLYVSDIMFVIQPLDISFLFRNTEWNAGNLLFSVQKYAHTGSSTHYEFLPCLADLGMFKCFDNTYYSDLMKHGAGIFKM